MRPGSLLDHRVVSLGGDRIALLFGRWLEHRFLAGLAERLSDKHGRYALAFSMNRLTRTVFAQTWNGAELLHTPLACGRRPYGEFSKAVVKNILGAIVMNCPVAARTDQQTA